MNERMRARPWVVHTQVDFARCSPRRRPTASAPPSCSTAALAEAKQLGMPRLVELGERVRADAAVAPRA